jgi:hypothetical protein
MYLGATAVRKAAPAPPLGGLHPLILFGGGLLVLWWLGRPRAKVARVKKTEGANVS